MGAEQFRDICVGAATKKVINFPIKDNGSARDLTSHTVTTRIGTAGSSATIDRTNTITDATAGETQFTITTSDFAASINKTFDMQIFDDDGGGQELVGFGRLIVTPTMT